MLDILLPLKSACSNALASVYGIIINETTISFAETKKEFEGEYTLVVFAFTKEAKKKPEAIGEELGEFLINNHHDLIADYNVIKGFLNLVIQPDFWHKALQTIGSLENHGISTDTGEKVMIEFSSPNTNKPLHLGHIRNILLGWSTSMINEAIGNEVLKTQIINDRGIAICKSMLAWQLFADGETPTSSAIKGDHFAGKYYIKFETEFRAEYEAWQKTEDGNSLFASLKKEDESKEIFYKRYKNTFFNEYSKLGKKAKEMLRNWENGDEETVQLWKKMNNWVYEGFDTTYHNLGVSFDKLYYESDTYLLGKNIVDQGLASDTFYKEEDGSVWVDLEDVGLDKKILLRSDGTSVYMTQDLGTAQMRYNDLGTSKMTYVVADEQDYHFQALFEILKKLDEPYADGLHHLSYGMVDLPTGKMKSREGTVVDADDLIKEVIEEVKKSADERGELEDLSEEERLDIYKKIGLAALKFFILKVNPKKRMLFNPKDSVDMQGQTGPYIQNAYVRIRSIRRKLSEEITSDFSDYNKMDPSEIDLLRSLITYPDVVQLAAKNYDPSSIANYSYELAKRFHKFYHDVRILSAETPAAKSFRMQLSDRVASVLEHSMSLLGIEMPERM